MQYLKDNLLVIAAITAASLLATGTGLLAFRLQASELSGAHEAYVADLSKCLAKNHTLVNVREVAVFLKGRGDDDVQILEFKNNRNVTAQEVEGGVGLANIPVELSLKGRRELEGHSVKTLTLRRKQADGQIAFKADKGRFWVPKAASFCERLRADWTIIDSGLNYQSLEENQEESSK